MKAKLMRRDPLVVLELTQDEAVMLRKALDAARGTSVEKGTLLSDGAVRELAAELLELHSANERQDAEIDRLSSALEAARLELVRLRRAATPWVEG